MPRRSSNSNRIARAAAEADATAKEKMAKKAAKKAAKKTVKKTAKKTTKKVTKKTVKKVAKRTTRATKTPQRMKIIWGVGKPGLAPVSHYAYRDRAAADAEAKRKGDEFMVRKVKVPMEDEPDAEPDADAEPEAAAKK